MNGLSGRIIWAGEDENGPPLNRGKKMTRVIIHIEGGIVQAVHSDEILDVRVYDLDCPSFTTMDEENGIKEKSVSLENEIKGLKQIY
ncbi:MAG: hypothetical protein WC055_00040 [Melioribacteraceae bacterium]